MKKFLYLCLTGLMVLSSTTRCMEQIIQADKEAQKGESVQTAILEPEDALKVHGPQLPAKEEVIKIFVGAAVAVSTMGRYGVASSEPFATMKDSYATLKAINKGNKEQTRLELFDGYCSADEEYYEKGLDDTDKTAQKIKALDSIKGKWQPKLNEHQKKFDALTQEEKELTEAIKVLLNNRTEIKEKLRKKEEEKAHFENIVTMHHNSKKQENSLLLTRKETLTEEIQALDERIAKYKEESNALLEGDVMQSVVADAIKDNSDVEAGLLEEKAKLQTKLDILNSVMAQLAEESNAAAQTPKKGWFSWK